MSEFAIKKATFNKNDVMCQNCMTIYHLTPEGMVEREKNKIVSFVCEVCGKTVQTFSREKQ